MKAINRYKNDMDRQYAIKLNSNESSKEIDSKYLEEAIKKLRDIKLNKYPDSDSHELKECYAKVIGVKSDNIIVGNGSDEMIALVINAIVSKGKIVLTLEPDFSMYDFYITANEGRIVKFKTNEDGSFKLNNFIKFAKDTRPDLIIFSNPNNPTGNALNNDDIERILGAIPRCKMLVDEAYYEFYGQTIISHINEHSNLIVTRTLSKAWGLAALRIGFLIANKTLVKELYRYKVPYNVNQLSQIIATTVLKYPEKVLNNVMEIVEERERLYSMLCKLATSHEESIKFYKSKGNFIFGRTTYLKFLINYIENQGVLFRYFNDDSFRITVGKPLEDDLIVSIINNALDEMEEDNGEKVWGS